MLTALQIINLRAPQFLSSPRLNDMIAYVREGISSTAFGDSYENAVALKTLHLMTIEKMNSGSESDTGINTGGTITSESEGALSRSYATKAPAVSGVEGDLNKTGYGNEYLTLVKTTNISPMNRTMGTWLQR